MLTNLLLKPLLISQKSIVTLLLIVVAVFLLLLILGIRKSYKLKKENEQLDKISEELAKQDETYKDFTEDHMYNNK